MKWYGFQEMLRLQNRSVVKVWGPDAKKFLHNITTNDVGSMEPQSTVYNLMLNSKGRYLFDFFLTHKEDGFLLECEKADAQGIIELLNGYRLMLKVRIRPKDEYVVYVDTDQSVGDVGHTIIRESGVVIFQDPRHRDMGIRILDPCNEYAAERELESSLRTYTRIRMQNAIPECSVDMVRGESFPMHFRLDQLNAICKNKGCYIGQEVTARMQRVGSRKTLCAVRSTSGEYLATGREQVMQREISVGYLVASTEEIGLCLIETEKIVSGEPVSIGSVECELSFC